MESRLDSSSTDHGSSSSIERRDPDSEAKHDDHDEQQGVHSFSKAVDEGESRIGLAETSHSRAGTRFRSVQSDSSVPMLRRAMEHECHDEEPQGQEPGQEKVERDQTTTGWTTRDTSAEAMADGAGRGETATTRDSATLVRPPLSTPALDHKAATVTVMESSSSSPAFGQLQFSSTPSEMRSSTASSLDQSRSTPVTEYSAVNSRTGMAAAVQNCASSTSGKSVKSSSVKEFDRFSLPTAEDIAAAEQCMLVGEDGEAVSFGELVRSRGKVVVVFLRHLWCGLCAQYVTALRSALREVPVGGSPSTTSLSTTMTTTSTSSNSPPPVYIILISSGSPSLIPIYRQKLDCVFPLYVDKRRTLYKALGMTLKTFSAGKDKDKGSYVTMSMAENVGMSIMNGFSMRSNPGSQRQLGGEFVMVCENEQGEVDLEGPIRCTYASRMNTTRSHSEVRQLFAAAGVKLPASGGTLSSVDSHIVE